MKSNIVAFVFLSYVVFVCGFVACVFFWGGVLLFLLFVHGVVFLSLLLLLPFVIDNLSCFLSIRCPNKHVNVSKMYVPVFCFVLFQALFAVIFGANSLQKIQNCGKTVHLDGQFLVRAGRQLAIHLSMPKNVQKRGPRHNLREWTSNQHVPTYMFVSPP